MNNDIEREAFEKAFPVPMDVYWSADFEQYEARQMDSEPDADEYHRMWQVWQAARAQGEPSSGVSEGWRDVVERAVDALGIMAESEGIAGWHLNGDIASWDEGDLPGIRDELQALLTAAPTPEAGQSGGVPEEATEEMLEACMSERDKQYPANAKRYLQYIWQTMIKHLPNPHTNQSATGAPDAYAVIDHQGNIDYTVTVDKLQPNNQGADWAESACHEHINECAGSGVEGAGQWVVRPLTIGANQSDSEQLEIERGYSRALERRIAELEKGDGEQVGELVGWVDPDDLEELEDRFPILVKPEESQRETLRVSIRPKPPKSKEGE